ncbi:hypothetical protein B0H67DRAFT_648339 [Lasiosphaeris hirsuta]|uniref:Molybdate-anion transporter n=1 Tax=Lasiosphaeris hirsuta TaxID=260670 RepID=A0AA40A2U6_9PEZI|nr:hypothetical protein B0H67DRAFT_648339 [Lasiosphaeris hirsuta]
MDSYTINLTILLALCGALFLLQHLSQPALSPTKKLTTPAPSQWPFLAVYTLAMASDWLQGPYLYSLYHDEHHIPPALISTLFTTGFVAGGVSGSVIGAVADRHGRKAACLVFCAAYALSCALTTTGLVPLLFAGRVLGGLGTSLLFSVFESWMVTDFQVRGLAARGADLGRTFGLMGSLNSGVAIVSGVGSGWLVGWAGTRKAPFVAAGGLLALAAGLIWSLWSENYGETGGKEEVKSGGQKSETKLWAIVSNPKVISLGLASTVFEGSMYLFVFFWTPALRSVQSSSPQDLPYGVIFASFMASTLASSLAFGIVTGRGLVSYTTLLLGILGTSSLCFLLSAQPRSEQSTFWVFCLFEAAVGMYFPCMGYLKGKLIEDGVRAQVYGMLRVPLNIFVVVSLLFTGDGDAFGPVFSVCSGLLIAACGALWAATAN